MICARYFCKPIKTDSLRQSIIGATQKRRENVEALDMAQTCRRQVADFISPDSLRPPLDGTESAVLADAPVDHLEGGWTYWVALQVCEPSVMMGSSGSL